MGLAAGLAGTSAGELLLIAGMALLASFVGGVTGYGTGVLMPLVLVPIAGAETVVPIIAITALFTNTSRALAFPEAIAWRRGAIVLACALPTCILSAYGFTLLSGRGAAMLIGATLIASVPLRRLLQRRGFVLQCRGLAVGAVAYGGLVGGTTGSGVVLLSLLMACGLAGSAVIATDAMISIATGIVKVAVFGVAGVVTAKVVAFAMLIGVVATPGAFVAKALVRHLPLRTHAAILDAVVLFGGAVMVGAALRS